MPATPRLADSHLMALARQGHLRLASAASDSARPWVERLYPLLALAFGALAPIAAGLFITLPVLAVLRAVTGFDPNNRTGSPDVAFAVFLIAGFLPIFAVIALWLWLFEARPLRTIGLERGTAELRYGRGMLVGLVMICAAVALMVPFGYVALDTGGTGARGTTALAGVLIVLAGWMVQGAAEEALARGFVLPAVGVRWGVPAGIVTSSLLFAGLHLLNNHVSPLALVNLLLFSVFAALYALVEGGLWGVCAAHSVWNWAQGNLLGFEVSGADTRWSMLFNLKETGPDWFTGGAFGPEGGLAVTVVLVGGVLWVWRVHRRRPSEAAHEPDAPH